MRSLGQARVQPLWKGEIRTQRQTPTEGGWSDGTGRGQPRSWRDAWTSQGAPRIFGKHQKPEEARKVSPVEPPESVWPCQHLDYRFLASRTVSQHISVVWSHSVLGTSLKWSWEEDALSFHQSSLPIIPHSVISLSLPSNSSWSFQSMWKALYLKFHFCLIWLIT